MRKYLGAFFPSALAVALIAVSLFVFILPETERSLLKKKQDFIRETTSIVISFLNTYLDQVESGALSLAEAQHRARARVREFRYGPENKDYFWIIGLDLVTLAHPYRPDHEGQDQSGLTDIKGKRFMVEAVELVKTRGEGFFSYHWQWQDDPTRVEEKLSHVKLFKPWGWVVGTGVYLGDVRQEIIALTRTFTYMGLVAVLLVGSLTGFISWRRYQSDRTKQMAEQALLEAYAKHHAVLQASPNPVILYDQQGRATFINPAFSRLFGYSPEEVLGRPIPYIPAEYQAATTEGSQRVYASQEGQAHFESVRIAKDGRRLSVSVSAAVFRGGGGQPAGMVVCLADITHIKQSERALRQTQKLEALGTLAGGIAHDFNNILGAITGFTELALTRLGDQQAPRQHLHKVLQACQRAKELIRQILTFARSSDGAPRPVEVRVIAKEVLHLLRATLPANIEMKTTLDSHAVVLADPTQIHQMLMNLCTNAAQAMDPGGGVLAVGLREFNLAAGGQADSPGLKPGPYLEISVRDSGAGIAPEILDKIFDPFFTTKGPSEGTGLGLAVVHGIAAKYGGRVSVESQPGQGAAFRVWLPTVDQAAAEDGQWSLDGVPRGGEAILLVDDEGDLVEAGRQMLELLGYRVTALGSSAQALEAFQAGPQAFDLLFSDQIMPGLSGLDLAREVLALRPGLPVIIYSGRSSQVPEEQARALGITILAKPLDLASLGRAVRQVLDGAASGAASRGGR
ncbi:MAG: cache domain-containing protein [Desulfarculus sp.]|nr:cache domain-containing protein [Desulfarculus sp.]